MDFLEIDKSDIKSVCLICFNAKHELHQLKTNPTVIELLQMFFKFEVELEEIINKTSFTL